MSQYEQLFEVFDEFVAAQRKIDQLQQEFKSDVFDPLKELKKARRVAKRKVDTMLDQYEEVLDYNDKGSAQIGDYCVKRRLRLKVPIDEDVAKNFVPSERFEEYIDAVTKRSVSYTVKK